jgi:hypothetical protein
MKMINFSIVLATDIDNLENNPKYDNDEALYEQDFKKAVICRFAVLDSSHYEELVNPLWTPGGFWQASIKKFKEIVSTLTDETVKQACESIFPELATYDDSTEIVFV